MEYFGTLPNSYFDRIRLLEPSTNVARFEDLGRHLDAAYAEAKARRRRLPAASAPPLRSSRDPTNFRGLVLGCTEAKLFK